MKIDFSKVFYIRACFWLVGLGFGSITAYTGRYFQNNDAVVYIEMGEAIWTGRWWDAVNFTFSPVYSVLVKLFQYVVSTSPDNEIIMLKMLNVLVLMVCMACFEFFMASLKHSWQAMKSSQDNLLDWEYIALVGYAVFLVSSLVSVRTRLINPDMLVMAICFVCFSTILSINRGDENYSRFVFLGIAIAIGYLTKAFFFLYAPALIFFAAFSCKSWRRAWKRSAVTLGVALIISGPLLVGLSIKKGSFSYGEGGRHVYAILFGSKGEPTNPGLVLNELPRTVEYEYGNTVTRPLTYDVSYWSIGIQPELKIDELFKLFLKNLLDVFDQSPWFLLVIIWFIYNIATGSLKIGPIAPLSPQLALIGLGILGVALFALVSMEPRYVAPFMCCFTAGISLSIRSGAKTGQKGRAQNVSSWVLTIILLGVLTDSVLDQSQRGLVSISSKPSYKESYEENFAVRKFLNEYNIYPPDKVAVIGSPPSHWARMTGLRITGEILFEDEFMRADDSVRRRAIDSLRSSGYKAIVGIGNRYDSLKNEGWIRVPDTQNFYAIIL